MNKVKPFTRKEFLAWLESQRGWCDQYVEEGHCTPEDASGDMATAILEGGSTEEDERAVAYLKSTRVSDLHGCLADYLFGVALTKK